MTRDSTTTFTAICPVYYEDGCNAVSGKTSFLSSGEMDASLFMKKNILPSIDIDVLLPQQEAIY